MGYASDFAWDQGNRRGFWTRRKKTALGLVTVLAIVGGIAMAFKLFDKTVGNNTVKDASSFAYLIFKKDPLTADSTFKNTAGCSTCTPAYGPSPVFQANVDTYPGDTRSVEVRIENTNAPLRDASFYVFADALAVKDAAGNTVTDVAKINTFTGFWRLRVDKETVVTAGGLADVNADDHGVKSGQPNGANTEQYDRSSPITYAKACEDGLKNVTRAAPCPLGMVRKAGATEGPNGTGARRDQRYYVFKLSESDQGDQTAYKGWSISFTLVFQARVPAEPEPAPAP